MQLYRMTDTWGIEPDKYKTKEAIFILAYELYCGNPFGQELFKAKRVLNSFEKAVKYIEQECGWKVRTLHV